MPTTFYPPHHFGGDATFVERLAHALARRGHRVDVICNVDAYRMLRPGVEPEITPDPEGIRVHRLESRFGNWSCLATQQTGRPLVYGRQIRRILADTKPDVIHFHNVSLVGGPGLLAYGEAIKLYTAHEHWLVCPTHILWRHGREPCPQRQCLRCVLRAGRPPQLWRSTGLLARKAEHIDAFLSPSAFSAAKHREFGFPVKMRELPLFLPDENRDPTPKGSASAERPYFLFAGRLEAIKGLQDVIPYFDDEAPAELWIAGSGNYEPELRKLAASSARVRFLGQKTATELRRLTAQARALIAPSRCYEVFPMVLLEAFREGIPVLARRLGPYPEVIEQSSGGLLFSDQASLRSALDRLVGEPALASELGQAGRRAFEQLWSEEVVLRHYFELISELAQRRGETELVERIKAAT